MIHHLYLIIMGFVVFFCLCYYFFFFAAWFLSIQVMMTLTMLSEIILLVLIAMFICKSKDGFWKLMSVGVGAIASVW